GSLGSNTFVDLDKPAVTAYGSPAPDELENAAEFAYDDDGNFTTILTADTARVGFASDDVTTPEQCLDAANSAPMGKKEKVAPGARIDVGTRLCVQTDKRAVALVEVTELGPDALFGRTVGLSVKLWKK
ncbi:MAG: hypothetical protein HOY78_19730, partial [Saccharothrix sp.]|nr:hypothetical protein [Saccharothrix sp.]